MEALGRVVSDRKIFDNFILKTYLWPRDILMQSIITVLTTLVGDPQGIISVEFGQIPISGLRKEVVWSFPYICECKIVISGMGQFWFHGLHLNNSGKGPLGDVIHESFGSCRLSQEDLWKIHFENLFSTIWTTYATNWNALNKKFRGPSRDHSSEVWSKSNERFQRRRC